MVDNLQTTVFVSQNIAESSRNCFGDGVIEFGDSGVFLLSHRLSDWVLLVNITDMSLTLIARFHFSVDRVRSAVVVWEYKIAVLNLSFSSSTMAHYRWWKANDLRSHSRSEIVWDLYIQARERDSEVIIVCGGQDTGQNQM